MRSICLIKFTPFIAFVLIGLFLWNTSVLFAQNPPQINLTEEEWKLYDECLSQLRNNKKVYQACRVKYKNIIHTMDKANNKDIVEEKYLYYRAAEGKYFRVDSASIPFDEKINGEGFYVFYTPNIYLYAQGEEQDGYAIEVKAEDDVKRRSLDLFYEMFSFGVGKGGVDFEFFFGSCKDIQKGVQKTTEKPYCIIDRIEKVDSEGEKELIRLDYHFENQHIKGHVLFDRANFWAVIEYETEVSYPGFPGSLSSYTGKIVYQENQGLDFPLLKQCESTIRRTLDELNPPEVVHSIYEISTIIPEPVPLEEFDPQLVLGITIGKSYGNRTIRVTLLAVGIMLIVFWGYQKSRKRTLVLPKNHD